ncbi:MAG TPA: long-chain fatty acid--CoA ligase [Anaerovoracaceae bacterium]|nr:long-chain fatty acid--CoA ligase [Anaerovoracaceae bacterium]
MQVAGFLKDSAWKYKNKTAIYFQDTNITYEQLNQEVNNLAQGLLRLGLKAEQRVCIILGNTPDFILSYFAITRAGGTVTPINPSYKREEIKFILNDSEAVLIITSKVLLPNFENIWDEVPSLNKVIVIDGDSQNNIVSYNELIRYESEPVELDIDGESIAACIYTSGTTGKPKGALLSHNNLIFDAEACLERIKYNSEDKHVCVLPLFHSFCQMAVMICPIRSGGSISILPHFLPDLVLKEIMKNKITVFCGVPTMFNALQAKLSSSNDYNISSLRICLVGGASMPVELIRAFENKYPVCILEGNGPTETSPVSYVNPPELRKVGSVGPPLKGVEVKIVDDNDNELQIGEIGEICVQGPNVMKGYLKQPKETENTIKDGWLHTGDLGKVDEDGYVYIIDRKKDMLIVGGINVYPREVEECLYMNDKVREAAVIGVSDGQRGEVPIAFIVLKEGFTGNKAEFAVYCRERLANYKCPKDFILVDTIPKNGSGKIDKKQIKEAHSMGLI